VLETPRIGLLVQSIGNSNSIKLSLIICSDRTKKTAKAVTLIDCGAEGEFIDWQYVHRNGIKTHELDKPIPI
jgi:hypothetical protein